tara:strand:- start:2839 stop:3462 length:624 start_codon:yes stop_codon:yes gene_type:complete
MVWVGGKDKNMITLGKFEVYKIGGKEMTIKLGDIVQSLKIPFLKPVSRADTYKPKSLESLKRFWVSEDITDAENFLKAERLIFNESVLRKKSNNYLKVLKSLKVNGYKPTKFNSGYIKITKENGSLCDGAHRFELLLARYGSEYEIDVWRVGFITRAFVLVVKNILNSIILVGLVIALLLKLTVAVLKIPVNMIAWIWKVAFRKQIR